MFFFFSLEHVIGLGSCHSLPLKMNYSVTRGYHIQITVQKNHPLKKEDLPPHFVQVSLLIWRFI